MNTLILFSALVAGQPSVPATFHCPTPTVARGDVKAGPPLLTTFELVNATSGTITIGKVTSACGCLRQGLGATTLQHGEKTKLTIEVNTLTQPDGPNRWQVGVSYTLTVPGQPDKNDELLLQMTATLSREIAVTPPQVAFSTTGAASQQLVVTDRRAKPLNVLKATSSVEHLEVEVSPAASGKQTITVKLNATAPAGHRDETVILHTDDAECPELRVPVRVLKRVANAVTATPEAVNVRFAAGQTDVSTLVQLRSPDGKAVTIAGVTCDFPGVELKYSPGAGAVATVRITVPETIATQPGRGTVHVRLAEPAGEVAIPVSWTGTKK